MAKSKILKWFEKNCPRGLDPKGKIKLNFLKKVSRRNMLNGIKPSKKLAIAAKIALSRR